MPVAGHDTRDACARLLYAGRMAKVQSSSFRRPDNVRRFDHGRVELVNLGESSVGRQVIEPGWRWSEHVKPLAGTEWCEYHHFGLVIAGRLHIEMADGTSMEVGPESVYEIPPGHDSWVVGDEPWIGIAWSGIRSFGAPLLATGERVLTTVVFTDIVGSTDTAARLGDDRWHALLADHNEATRRAIEQFQGLEVKTTGDGFLVRFDAPARALACAKAMRAVAESLGLQLRTAAHTGEVEVVGDDIRGLAVHLASRLVGLADPGEILASATTRDLVDGSGFVFESRGRHELKGIVGPREVFGLVPS
jgi:class 3 adenylate cyclase